MDVYRLAARDVMTHPVVCVHPQTPLVEVVRTLIAERISGVPVVDKLGRLVGIVTRADVLKAFATSDAHLHGDVRRALLEAKFDPDGLGIDVHDHVVTIGPIADAGERSLVAALVGGLDGVAGVEFAEAPRAG